MPKLPYSRISITLPPEVLAEADRLAQEQKRPRSWIIAEAIRNFAEPPSPAHPAVAEPRSVVAEPRADLYAAAEVATARLDRLRSDLTLSPAERMHRAQELVGLARTVHPRPTRDRVLGFNRPEEFHSWKKVARAGG